MYLFNFFKSLFAFFDFSRLFLIKNPDSKKKKRNGDMIRLVTLCLLEQNSTTTSQHYTIAKPNSGQDKNGFN